MRCLLNILERRSCDGCELATYFARPLVLDPFDPSTTRAKLLLYLLLRGRSYFVFSCFTLPPGDVRLGLRPPEQHVALPPVHASRCPEKSQVRGLVLLFDTLLVLLLSAVAV